MEDDTTLSLDFAKALHAGAEARHDQIHRKAGFALSAAGGAIVLVLVNLKEWSDLGVGQLLAHYTWLAALAALGAVLLLASAACSLAVYVLRKTTIPGGNNPRTTWDLLRTSEKPAAQVARWYLDSAYQIEEVTAERASLTEWGIRLLMAGLFAWATTAASGLELSLYGRFPWVTVTIAAAILTVAVAMAAKHWRRSSGTRREDSPAGSPPGQAAGTTE